MKITPGILAIENDPTPWLLIEPNDRKDFCVLWLQGWNATIKKHETILRQLAKQTNIAYAILDYAGHGTHPISLEQTTREQQLNEALAAYDALKARGYKHIIVAGTSFGGYLTALLSGKRDPFALVLRAAAIYPDDEFSMSYDERIARHSAYQKFKHTVTSASNLTALRAIKNFQGSVYVVEHEIDSVIPKNILHAYFENAQRGNYLIIPATDHALKRMPHPESHYAYVKGVISSIVTLAMLEKDIPKQ